MRLIKPTVRYKKSFFAAVREFQQEGRNLGIKPRQTLAEFKAYVKTVKSQSRGLNLPKGYVAATKFWLIDNNKFIGSVSVRHRLTKYLRAEGGHIGYEIRPSERRKGYGKSILKMILQRIGDLGIKKAIITCDVVNVGSKKIIESNGGIFIDKTKNKEGKNKMRYWIKAK